MDNHAIDLAMRRFLPSSIRWMGVFPLDTLDLVGRLKPGSCLVINTDPSWRPGEHWVGVYLPKRPRSALVFVDPYALPLHRLFKPIGRFLKRQHRRILQSPYSIQQPLSRACGPLVVYILIKLPSYDGNLPTLIHTEFSPTQLRANESRAYKYLAVRRIANV